MPTLGGNGANAIIDRQTRPQNYDFNNGQRLYNIQLNRTLH